MFFILSKLLSWLLTPLSWILICFIASFWLRSKAWRKRARTAALLLLLFFSNPGIANLVTKWWEIAPIEIRTIQTPYDVGIVLTGVTYPLQEPKDRVHFAKGADRLLHAIQLYHEGKIRNILISGGSGSLLHQEVSESAGLARVALMAGVRPEHLFVEGESRNTRENAQFSTLMINNNWPDKRCLLITSAFHMRRSLACFKKAGLETTPFTTDFYSSPWEWNPGLLVVPSTGSISTWEVLIREWVGMAAYWAAGYI